MISSFEILPLVIFIFLTPQLDWPLLIAIGRGQFLPNNLIILKIVEAAIRRSMMSGGILLHSKANESWFNGTVESKRRP